VFVPGYFAPMTNTFIGYVLLAIAAGLVIVGNLIIQRMTTLEA
jgi:Flp pilus assembly protein TadB